MSIIITNVVKHLAISKAEKLGFVFNPSDKCQTQYDSTLDYEHMEAIAFLSNLVETQLKYKLIKDVSVNKHTSDQNIIFTLPIDGICESQGEFFYNKNLKRFEHGEIDSDGSKYLVVWK